MRLCSHNPNVAIVTQDVGFLKRDVESVWPRTKKDERKGGERSEYIKPPRFFEFFFVTMSEEKRGGRKGESYCTRNLYINTKKEHKSKNNKEQTKSHISKLSFAAVVFAQQSECEYEKIHDKETTKE